MKTLCYLVLSLFVVGAAFSASTSITAQTETVQNTGGW